MTDKKHTQGDFGAMGLRGSLFASGFDDAVDGMLQEVRPVDAPPSAAPQVVVPS